MLDQLEANPVSQRNPGEASAAGLQTLTTAEEDQLSSRYVRIGKFGMISIVTVLALYTLDWLLYDNQTKHCKIFHLHQNTGCSATSS